MNAFGECRSRVPELTTKPPWSGSVRQEMKNEGRSGKVIENKGELYILPEHATDFVSELARFELKICRFGSFSTRFRVSL